MQNENPLTPAEQELERALSHLLPAPPGGSSESIAYQAGRRSTRPSLIFWRATTFAIPLALILFPRPIPPASSLPQPIILTNTWNTRTESPPSTAYLSLRDAVLAHGLDALPPAAPTPRANNDPPTRAGDIHSYPLHIPNFFGEQS